MTTPDNLIAECNGKLFVRIDAVMSPIIAHTDGLPITFFEEDQDGLAYLDFDTAITWCKKERDHHSRDKYDKIIASLEHILTTQPPQAISR